MNSHRLIHLAVVAAALAAPLAAAAAPAPQTSATCTAPTHALVERRISEEAARGLPALIAFVDRTRPFYQLNVVEVVAAIDAERTHPAACTSVADAALAG